MSESKKIYWLEVRKLTKIKGAPKIFNLGNCYTFNGQTIWWNKFNAGEAMEWLSHHSFKKPEEKIETIKVGALTFNKNEVEKALAGLKPI